MFIYGSAQLVQLLGKGLSSLCPLISISDGVLAQSINAYSLKITITKTFTAEINVMNPYPRQSSFRLVIIYYAQIFKYMNCVQLLRNNPFIIFCQQCTQWLTILKNVDKLENRYFTSSPVDTFTRHIIYFSEPSWYSLSVGIWLSIHYTTSFILKWNLKWLFQL